MAVRISHAEWQGDLRSGRGTVQLGSGALTGDYSYESRFEQGRGTNPEELIGAAHAGCFSMALAAGLAKAGYAPRHIRTTAEVHLDKTGDGFSIMEIRLSTEAEVPGIDEATFMEQANAAKQGCPVSKALAGTVIHLDAKLLAQAVAGRA